MVKKRLIIIGSIVGAVLIPNGVVLAKTGVDGWEAFVKALEYGLLGLGEYFEFVIDLFNLAMGA